MRIALFSHYPEKPVIHGGQRRTTQIADAYRSLGHEVEWISIVNGENYGAALSIPPDEVGTVNVMPELAQAICMRPHLEDIIIGRDCLKHQRIQNEILTTILRSNPDAYQLEGPYLWPTLKTLMNLGLIPRRPIIYCGHNNEAQIKPPIYRTHLDASEVEEAINSLVELEADLIKNANICTAITESDADSYTKRGARKVEFLPVVHNRQPATTDSLARWKSILNPSQGPIALFISSNHQPNIDSFFELFGENLGFLPPGYRLVIAGAISTAIEQKLSKMPLDVINSARLITLGVVSDEDLNALHEICDVLPLPITRGGGANVKVAQAIAYGKRIVCTQFALRGYNLEQNEQLVTIANTRDEFRQVLAKTMAEAWSCRLHTPEGSDTPVSISSQQITRFKNALIHVFAAVEAA
ncbi:glycosyltransferase family protein [Calycomorphotria hydatis]|uniref:Glycosyl transferases group 1 n=1 Tax=Calycomorphotria hydatis TaxID=2528027 RepID=A0A517T7C9_9PLAN|nr:glycosyltransferase [Calycomorphotria hydatis]QDT64278.1 hypothetical protein V22_15100 [Calycomorphotria hydatis]